MTTQFTVAIYLTAITVSLVACWSITDKGNNKVLEKIAEICVFGSFLCFPCTLIAWSVFLPYGAVYIHTGGALIVFAERIRNGRRSLWEDPFNNIGGILIISVVFGFPPIFLFLLGRLAYLQVRK